MDGVERYAPLLQVTLEHAYYADGLCRGLQFAPSEDTATWLRQRGCLCREDGASLLVLAPPADEPPSGAAPVLSWRVSCRDTTLAAVSQALPRGADELLLLQPTGQPAAQGQPQALHSGEAISREERWPLTWPAIVPLLTPADRRTPPLAVLRVPAPQVFMRYRARIAARATLWRYWLVGDWNEGALRVVDATEDAAERVQFTEPAEGRLDDGRRALAVQSLKEIELRQRPTARFQLRSRAAAAERVLVKRLPVAGADPFVRETPDPRARLVSEIYVHR